MELGAGKILVPLHFPTQRKGKNIFLALRGIQTMLFPTAPKVTIVSREWGKKITGMALREVRGGGGVVTEKEAPCILLLCAVGFHFSQFGHVYGGKIS